MRLRGERSLLQVEHALFLLGGHGGFAELGGELVHAHEVFAELGGGSASGGAGVVEFVHQARGEGAEGGHLLLLDGGALDIEEAPGHVAEDGFADFGAARHQVPELFFIEL